MSLTERFASEIEPLLMAQDGQRLRDFLYDWTNKLSDANPKTEFNCYDHDDAMSLFDRSPSRGVGWSALWLEHCRQGGITHFVSAGNEDFDFCVIARELGIAIPANCNRITPGTTGKICLDALGVRRDGTFCVIEIKGPGDQGSTRTAMLQGLCGALGIFAKRDDLVLLAQSRSGRRPAILNAGVLAERSIGLYVVAATSEFEGRLTSVAEGFEVPQAAQMVLRAWPPLREIALFRVQSLEQITSGQLREPEIHRPV